MKPRELEDLKRINAAADELNAEDEDVLDCQAIEEDFPADLIPHW